MSNKRNKYIALMISLIMLFEFVPLSVFSEETVVVDKSESQTVPVILEPEETEEPETDEEVFWEEVISEHIDDYTVTVTVTKEAEFPIGTTVTITPLSSGAYRNEAANLFDQSDNKLGSFIRVFDITFWYDDMEIEPLVPVDVKVTFDNAVELEGNNELKLIHLHEDEEAKEITAETETTETEDSEAIESLSFQSDKFSTYIVAEEIVVYTFSESGNNYEVVLKVNSAMGIPEDAVFTVDEITKDSDLYDQYAAQVAAVINPEGAVRMPALLDISLKTADGEKIQLDNKVQVIVRLTDEDVKRGLQVVHFPGEDPFQGESAVRDAVQSSNESDEIEVLNIESERLYPRLNTSENTVTFNTDSFSVFALAYKLVTYYTAASGETYKITLGYDETSGIPTDSELKVAEILPGNELYNEYLKQANHAALGDEYDEEMGNMPDQYARFFDIEIQNNGQKIEPKGKVSVTIELADAPEGEELKVVHFADKGIEVINAKLNESGILFNTESFSTYGVIVQPQKSQFTSSNIDELIGKGFTISRNGSYAKASIINDAPTRIDQTPDASQAAVWYIEKLTDKGNVYYKLYTLVSGVKKYVCMDYNTSENYSQWGKTTSTTLNENGARWFVIEKNNNNSYTLKTWISELQVNGNRWAYLNHWNNDGFTGFYVNGHSEGKDGNADALTLTVIDNAVSEGEPYAVIIKYNGNYYSVKADGSMIPVTYDPNTNLAEIDYPLLWTYRKLTNKDGYDWYALSVASEGIDYRSLVAVDFKYRFISVNDNDDGLEEAVLTNNTPESCGLRYIDHKLQGCGSSSGLYIGVSNSNGKLSIIGEQSFDQAAEVYLAKVKATTVPAAGAANNTVNHLDVSVYGSAQITLPLDRGSYYDIDGNVLFTVNRSNPVTLTLKQKVDITEEDIKNASITATDKNGEVKNAFYITGYSSNQEDSNNEDMPPQIRLEGSFKVADNITVPYQSDWINGKTENENYYSNLNLAWNPNHQNLRNERKNNQITYEVSLTKSVTFTLMDGDQILYDKDTHEPLTITMPVTLTGGSSYWSNKNKCPGTGKNANGPEQAWIDGCIVGDGGTLSSGIDFVLGGSVSKTAQEYPSVDIFKSIVDENGDVIETEGTLTNSFTIYQADNSGKSATPLENTDSAYKEINNVTVQIEGGRGSYYLDLDIPSAMVYIEENISSIPKTITVGNETWTYVKTEIQTEYVKRDGTQNPNHTTGDLYLTNNVPNKPYKSQPEVVGKFTYNSQDKEDWLLDFFVYNVYRREATITVEKDWADAAEKPLMDSDEYLDHVTVELHRKNKSGVDQIVPNTDLNEDVNTKRLDDTNEWKCEWTDLDTDYTYYIVEQTEELVSKGFMSPSYRVNGTTISSDGIQQGTIQLVNRKNSLKVKLRKYKKNTSNSSDTSTPVEGAKFQIYTQDGWSANPKVLWADKKGNTTFTTNSKGIFYEGYLPVGVYYLVETEPASGYMPLAEPIIFELLDIEHQVPGRDGQLLRYKSESDSDWQAYWSADKNNTFNLYVPNEEGTYLTVKKEWKNASGGNLIEAEKTAVTVELWQHSKSGSGSGGTGSGGTTATLTINRNCTDGGSENTTYSQFHIGDQITYTFVAGWAGLWNPIGLSSFSASEVFISEEGYYKNRYTLTFIISDSESSLTFNQNNGYLEASVIGGSSGGSGSASSDTISSRADATQTLSSSNNWTYSWVGLDSDFTYYVKETTSLSGFNAPTYTYNGSAVAPGGIESGTITVTNQKELVTSGSLKLKKTVQVDGDTPGANANAIAGSLYHFTIRDSSDTAIKYVLAEVNEAGAVSKYYVSNTDHEHNNVSSWSSAQITTDEYAVIANLEPGSYTITEDTTLAGMTTTVSNNGSAPTTGNTITVNVTAGEIASAQVEFTNNVQTGSIKLRKIVQKDGVPDSTATRDYYFSLQLLNASGNPLGDPMYINIWMNNGAIGDYRIMTKAAFERGDYKSYPGDTSITGITYVYGNTDDYAVINNLKEGDYWLTEIDIPSDVRLTGIERGDQDNTAINLVNSRVKVHVTAGQNTIAIDSSAVAVFTNTKVPVADITATKNWTGTSNDVIPTAIEFTLYRSTTDEEAYAAADSSDKFEKDSTKYIKVPNGAVTNPVVITPTISGDTVTWPEAEWTDLPEYEDITVQSPVSYSYIVKETGAAFNTVWFTEQANLEHDSLKLSEMYDTAYLSGTDMTGKVAIDHVNHEGSIMITNTPKTTEAVVEKNWSPDFTDPKYTWEATFVLKSSISAGQAVEGFKVKSDAIGADPHNSITISNESTQDEKTIAELPTFVLQSGTPKRIVYTMEETSYTVKYDGSVVLSVEDGTVISGNEDPYTPYYHTDIEQDGSQTVSVSNTQQVNRFVVKKKWLGVIDPDTMPAIKFQLMYVIVENGNFASKDNWKPYEINGTNEFELSANTNPKWEMSFDALPETIDGKKVYYFVQEVRNDMNNDGDRTVKYEVPGITGQPFEIHVDGYESDQGHYSDTWDHPYNAYIDGGTGTITIRNRCPSEYMQIDIKKKILEYRKNPEGGNSSLYTTTSTKEGMSGLVMKVQLYRRAVHADDNLPSGLAFTSKYPGGPLTGWIEYGEPMLIGYDPDGSPVAINPNEDLFRIRRLGSEGAWHWTIGNTSQNEGLPRNGFYTDEYGVTYPVRYQYWVVEIDAYKDRYGTPLEFSYMAATPAAWDGCGEGVACQFYATTYEVAQDQDRIINHQTTDLKITKQWNVNSDGREVYVKLYRIANQSYDANNVEDYTNKLNGSIDTWLAEHFDIGKHGYTSATIKTPSGGAGNYIVLQGNETITIHNLEFGSLSGAGYYRYWIKEMGYKDQTGVHWINDENPQITVNYSVDHNEYKVELDNIAGKVSRISPIITLGKLGENHFTITNDVDNVKAKPVISKKLNGTAFSGKDSTDTDREFTYVLTQIYPEPAAGQTAYSQTVTSGNSTVSFQDIVYTSTGEYRYEIAEQAVAGDTTMAYDITKYYVKIVVNKDSSTGKLITPTPVYYSDRECQHSVSEVVFKNKEVKKIVVQKVWKEDGKTVNWPEEIESVTIELYQSVEGGTPTTTEKTVTFGKDAEDALCTFSDLPIYDDDGKLITYSIKEKSIKPTNGDAASVVVDHVTVTNLDSWAVSVNNANNTVTNEKAKMDIHVLKVQQADRTKALTGARFKLQKLNGSDYEDYGDSAEQEVNGSGQVTYEGLTDGSYQLIETQAPTGYYALSAEIRFTVTNGAVNFTNTEYVEYDLANKTFKVGNKAGAELPATGGRGTALYTFLGLMIILLAGGLLVYNKRRNSRENK